MMLNPKGYIIEFEKDGRVDVVIVVAASKEQALDIARREKDTEVATVIDEAKVIFAD